MTTRQIHNLEVGEVFSLLRSSADGLAPDVVETRLSEIGANVLSPPPRLHWLSTLGRQFANLFSILLDVSALLCFVADRMRPGEGMALLGFALIGVAILNGLFSFIQEMRAERAMQALEKLLPQQIAVRRAGREQRIPTAELVPGDVLLLAEGDRVPADARLVSSTGLLVNNAPLTGESRHVSLEPGAVSGGRLVDSPNLVFAGASVLRGSGTAVVYATGRRTEFGKIAALSVQVRRPPTPLTREVGRMVRILTALAVAMGLSFFACGVAIGRPVWVNVVFMLGIIVANVPEGLLPTLTLALAMGGLRLAKKNVLVKSLDAVESLGSVEVICTDKTGTLTKNELAVASVVGALDARPLGAPAARRLLEYAVAASEVHLQAGELTGDPLDVAAARALADAGVDPLALGRDVVRHIPFDVERRRAAGVIASGAGQRFVVKGAWEVVRSHLTALRSEPDVIPLSEAELARAEATVRRMASRALRVIAVASREITPETVGAPEAELFRGLVLEGFLCLEDPLRPEVPEALSRCREAGIRVLLVTGDHPDTARAIAERAGIVEPSAGADVVLGGDALERLREHELVAALRSGLAVFARTTPEQKLKIVGAVKRLGLLVGMTGDGVNDAPALRAADVGIAMGKTGTDVAREAAQIVLLDDNFASIVAGVEEGRTVFSNVQKFTSYVLASNVPEIVPFLCFVVLPVPLALSVIQILVIDLGTDIVPAIGLGQEPPDGEAMKRRPRGLSGRLLSRSLVLRSYLFLGGIEAAFAMAMFFWVLVRGGWHYAEPLAADAALYRSATTLTLVAVVFTQIGNLVSRRYESRLGVDRGLFENPLFVVGVGAELGFVFLVTRWPPLMNALETGALPWSFIGLAAFGAPLMLLADYARKRLTRRASAR